MYRVLRSSFFYCERVRELENIDVLTYFLTQGPFAVLFVWLLISTQNRNAKREDKLHETLSEFAQKYDIVIDKLDKIHDRLPPS